MKKALILPLCNYNPTTKLNHFIPILTSTFSSTEVFDDFLRAYLTKFRKKSLDTEQFKAFLLEYFKDNQAIKQVDWDSWLHKSGMPPIIPE